MKSNSPYPIHSREVPRGGAPVLLLHGYAASSYSWRHQLEDLHPYSLYAPDLLGFGQSAKPLDLPYSLELYGETLFDFIASRSLKEIHLVGHSMGGAIALYLATQKPELFSSLTLIAPAAYPMLLPFPLRVARRLGKFLFPFYGEWLISRSLKTIFHDPKKIAKEAASEYAKAYLSEGGKEVALKVLRSFDNALLETLSQNYAKIKLPTLLLWGEKDSWISPKNLERFKRDFPHGRQVVIPQCGHSPPEEAPEQVNEELAKFFEGIKPC